MVQHSATHCNTLQHTATHCTVFYPQRCKSFSRISAAPRTPHTKPSPNLPPKMHKETALSQTHRCLIGWRQCQTMTLMKVCVTKYLREALSCVLQCVAVCCSVLQRFAVCCIVLQCVAVCCSVWLNICVDKRLLNLSVVRPL